MKSTYRWVVLGIYALAAALSQLLWLNFAPILSQVEKMYGVTETQASLLILVFPLIYVALSLPAGTYIDRHGYRRGVGLGVVLMTVFSCLRIYTENFYVLLAAQIGIAVAQPYIINGISKLVMDWFPKSESAIATGLGTVGMFVGMAAGLAITPVLVTNFGLSGAMVIFAAVNIVTCVAFFIFVRENKSHGNLKVEVAESYLRLFQDKALLLLFFLSFTGLGFFNGLTTWLELILAPHGINSEQAGIAGGTLIVGGIVGAAVIPALSDHFKKRKPFLIGSIAVAMLTVYPLCNGTHFHTVLIFSALQGFFFLPAFSLLLEMCSELVGELRAASATGMLMLAGNAGGVIVVLAMEWVKGGAQDFSNGVHLLFALLLISLAASFFTCEAR